MHTPEFRRHFVEFVPGDSLMTLRLATKGWKAAADAFIDEGVRSDAIIVHGGNDIINAVALSGARKERKTFVTRVGFLLNITKGGDSACACATNLVDVEIPEGIESIGEYAFYRCTSLTTVSFPSTLTSIGLGAFSRCSSLDNVDLRHTNLQKLSSLAFYECSQLKSMTIPDSLQTLCRIVFGRCFKLVLTLVPSNIIVSSNDDTTSEVVAHLRSQMSLNALLSGNNILNTDDFHRLLIPFIPDDTLMAMRKVSKPLSRVADGFISDGAASGAFLVHGGNDLSFNEAWDRQERRKLATRVIFLLNITKVGESAYAFAINLVVVDIPEGFESIGKSAFHHCRSLTTVSFPTTLTSIGQGSFRLCSSLKNVDLCHTNLQEIGKYAFMDCSELKSMTIPDSL
ncbi:hypothetical protein TrLO_g1710 [Triparma laevis f. longispina]|uniref:Surface antigen BspA-like n=1 Tax=Triparma laevis f. longispina TaxID=1714387 RepID=A0A9W7KZL5_9STRA|nr:hypothetical protein TrLO_g1710 [Triparma laevis f. longispina]